VGKRVKFNVQDIFLDGQNTVADRTLFVSSPLFPAFASLYNRSEGKVRVGLLGVTDAADGRYVNMVPVVNDLGLLVGNIFNQGRTSYNTVGFEVVHDPFEPDFTSARIRSGNPKYLQHKLSPTSGHEVADSFDTALNNSKNAMNSLIYRMIYRSVENKGDASSAPVFDKRNSADDNMITFLAAFFAGEVGREEMPSNHRTEFEDMYRKYTAAREKFKSALKDTYDMVATEKWVYLDKLNGGVLLGAIRPEPMCAALDQLMKHGHLPYGSGFSYIQEAVPFKWYPSYEHIPEDLRQQLDFSMVMLKAHNNGTMPSDSGESFFYELGCWHRKRGYERTPSVYVLTK
jgi:hypothetical protein